MRDVVIFTSGIIVGIVAFWFYRWLVDMIDGYGYQMGAPNRPQIVAHPTRETPSDVVDRAKRARFKLFLILVVLVGAGIAFIALLGYLVSDIAMQGL